MTKIIVPGFRFAGVAGGIKKNGKPDVALLVADESVPAAGVFTQNRVRAAPVILSERRVAAGRLRGVVVNSGNANACTGERGEADADEMTRILGRSVGAGPEELVVASTGVIGVPLPMDRVRSGIDSAAAALSPTGFTTFADAILTTDKGPKVSVARAGDAIVAGCAKGAGMIAPQMATTLAFVVTDAQVDPAWLQETLLAAAGATFNSAIVDGDTSTNDTLLVFASGRAGRVGDDRLKGALFDVLGNLADMLVRDGEGATKLVRVRVTGARTDGDAQLVARRIATSPLVKTALHGADPNWGRIMCAVGNAGVDIDPRRIDLDLGPVAVVRGGAAVVLPSVEEIEAAAHQVMREPSYEVRVALGLGSGSALVTTCDLTHEYITINASYRS
jgi:glutamate N-acetyltransferase / amino-acid N-acetyltransferase